MIRQFDNNLWILETENTSYIFSTLPTGQLEHLHYGKKLYIEEKEDAEVLREKHVFQPGNSVVYDQSHLEYSLEDMRLEMSSFGKGDIREPFVEIEHGDGGFTNDFVFKSSDILSEKLPLEGLPSAYGEAEELVITLVDQAYNIELELHYCVFEREDVITRYSVVKNNGQETITLRRLMSTQIDFDEKDYILTTFGGSWAREMNPFKRMVSAGKVVNSTVAGASSNRANPFVMLSKEETTECAGECYGLNLIYSGNHYEAIEVNGYNKTRFVSGINPTQFAFELNNGESFTSPEAIMCFSLKGFEGMSHSMHQFVREHIVRGTFKNKVRPVLLNSWEAAYFDINESKLLKLAKAGKDVGIELFVMDDGWFGERDNDSKSLGDWKENRKKLPGGVKQLAQKVNAMGMEFGIWVEPEMVNVDSNLYRQHPEWTMEIPGKSHSEGRNQRILDLCNPEVCDYLIATMSDLFESANISYVKWDMNRIFSDCYSPYLKQQGETAHRYMLGLYRVMKELTDKFPEILFEGCASGGNRFDLGILCYFPQIWASDNTDAICRVKMQTAYSYGYPLNVMGAHVSSCPNHQTLRNTPLDTRFAVAAFGVCGYECNLADMKKDELDEIKEQISLYKKWREVFQLGDFYRGRNGNVHEWTCVSRDQKRAVGMILQELVQPNTQGEHYYAKGLNPKQRYHFYNYKRSYNIKNFGDLVNTVAPIHIKQDSIVHNTIAKFVKMPGETEDYNTSGAALMAGVRLKPGFGGTGYNEETRYFQDFSSRLYFMEGKECDTI